MSATVDPKRRAVRPKSMLGQSARVGLASALLAGAGLVVANDLEEMRAQGTLRVLATTGRDHDPFFSGDRSGPGFDREILAGFAESQRMKLEVVTVESADDLIPALLLGKGDLIAGAFTMTEARRVQIEFAAEVFLTKNIVLTVKPHPPIETLSQLIAVPKVGTGRSAAMREALWQAGVSPAAIVISDTDLAQGLRQGQFSAALVSLEMGLAAARTNPDLQLGTTIGPPRSLAYGVRREDVALRDALSGFIAVLRQSGGWNRLVTKYFGDQAIGILKKARR